MEKQIIVVDKCMFKDQKRLSDLEAVFYHTEVIVLELGDAQWARFVFQYGESNDCDVRIDYYVDGAFALVEMDFCFDSGYKSNYEVEVHDVEDFAHFIQTEFEYRWDTVLFEEECYSSDWREQA